MRKFLFALLFSGLFHSVSSAQSEWRNWTSAEISYEHTKKLDFKLTQLLSFNMSDSFSNNFNQTSLQADYDITKNISLRGAAMLTQFPSSNTNTVRGIFRVSYKFNPLKMLTWTNSLQAEYHSTQETRYRERFIYVSRLALRKRLKFLKLSPSITYWLYYNIGGSTIKYYDATGANYIRNTPDGLHRGRLFINLNSKINSRFQVSLYYMNQQEFNLFTPTNRKMNVSNPNTGKIYRPFDRYNVLGITGILELKRKKTNKE